MNKVMRISVLLLCGFWGLSVNASIREQTMKLYVGQSEFIADSSITRIAVGSDEVLNAVGIDRKGVLLTGIKTGDTTIKVWRGNSLQTINTHIYPANLPKMLQDIRVFIQDFPNTSARILGDRIVVDGSHLDAASKNKIDTFLAQFNYVTNLTTAKSQNPDATDQRMIYFDVKILEISKSNLENLGIQWSNQTDGLTVGVAGDLKKSKPYINGAVSEDFIGAKISPFASYVGLASTLTSKINLMESQGLAKLIAHPVLSCKNGGTANFLSGGQVPFNVASANGTPAVEFKEYGIKLTVAPVIQPDNSIVAKLTSEFSEVDSSVTVDGTPGLLTRRTETEFSLNDGQTIMLSGLNSLQKTKSHTNVPSLHKIPVVGGLFKNRASTDKQTELVFVVTPTIYSESDSHTKILEKTNSIIQQSNESNDLLPKDFFNSTENRIYFDKHPTKQ